MHEKSSASVPFERFVQFFWLYVTLIEIRLLLLLLLLLSNQHVASRLACCLAV